MIIARVVRKYWSHPLVRGINVDNSNRLPLHRKIIQSKPLLRNAYFKWYEELLPAVRETSHLKGEMIEIGCGAGYLEEVIPGLVKTDSLPNPFAEKILDAMKLDYPDNSLRAIFVIGVLHHVPFPAKFLAEAQRCLQPQGRLVLVEPSNTFPQRILCKLLNHYEYSDDKVTEWQNNSDNNMTDANLALPWVIFVRDRVRFDREFSALKIRDIRYHTFLRIILSGGMSFRSFLPGFAIPLIEAIELLFRPFMKTVGTCMTIDVEKQ